MPRISDHVAGISEAMSVKYNNLVYELKGKGEEVTVLSLGEAFFDLPRVSLEDVPHPAGLHYSHSRGVPELRDKIAAYYKDRFGVALDPARELLVTAGSKAAIYFSMMAVLSPGDEVLIPEPMWVSYPEQARLCFARPVSIPYPSRVEDFDRYISDATRMLVINNPSNPSGYVYTKRELRYLVDLARANDIYLLADEAYSDFDVTGEFASAGRFDGEKQNLIICNSISKNLGVSGWRIGYAISNAVLIGELLKLNQHVVTCAPTNLQHYLARNFDVLSSLTAPQIAAVVEKRQVVVDYAVRIGLHVLPGTAGFYVFLSLGSRGGSEDFALRLLREEKICVVPGVGYGGSCDGFVRISVGSEPLEKIFAGLERIKALIGGSTNA